MTGTTSGFQQPNTFGADYNSLRFIITSLASLIRTGTPCEVLSVTNDGSISPVGYVNLQPMVNQVSGNGLSQPEGVIKNVPYFRLQGGSSAIIMDPQVGDIGFAHFADNDTSGVIKNKAQSNPGSARQFDVSDGWFFPCFLGGTPTQGIQFNESGITIFTPGNVSIQAGGNVTATAAGSAEVTAGTTASVNATTSITLAAPDINLNGNTAVTGNFSYTGTGTNAGTDVGKNHEHNVVNVQGGSSTITTTPPVS